VPQALKPEVLVGLLWVTDRRTATLPAITGALPLYRQQRTSVVDPRQLSLRARTEQVQQGMRAEDLVGRLLLPLGENGPSLLVPWSNSDLSRFGSLSLLTG
jgi:hypothetical protein